MRKDPERRFQSAADLKVVLQELWDLKVAERVLPTASIQRLALPPASAKRLPSRSRLVAGGETTQQAFADGLVEMLSGKLALLKRFYESLSVVGTSEVRREGVTRPPDARRAFGVNLAIEGRVGRPAGEVRILLRLVEAPGGRLLGSRTVRAPLDRLTELQDGLVREGTRLLKLDLTPEAQRTLATGNTSRAGAYDLYLQARGTLRRYDRAGDIDQAISLFSKRPSRTPVTPWPTPDSAKPTGGSIAAPASPATWSRPARPDAGPSS